MLNSKWYLGIFLLFIIIAVLVLVTEGQSLSVDEAGRFDTLSQLNWDSVKSLPTLLRDVFTWNFAFFMEGLGAYIRPFLLILSGAILIPFLFEVARLIRSILPW